MRFQTPDALDVPHGGTVLWRYMSHSKFQDLLQTRALFFTNAEKLTDQYEISVPEANVQKKRRALKRAGLSKEKLDIEMKRFLWAMNPDKALTLLSCWTTRRSESYAFWKIYVGMDSPGVALRTTVSRLRRALSEGADPYPEDFFMGRVKYRTYLPDADLYRFQLVCTKKPFYDFENELRVFLLHYTEAQARLAPYDVKVGRRVSVTLDNLLTRVVVSPFAEKSYRAEVESMVREAGLRTDVRGSEILDK